MRLDPSHTAVLEPGVELGITPELRSGHEEPSPDNPNLVLDLSLLPARGRCAGDRVDQVVPVHPLEPAVVRALATGKDRVHRGLHVIADAPRTGSAEEGEGLVLGVEDHLLRLAQVGPDEQHPAVAKPDMRHLHGCRRPIDHHNLVAPVELVGLAWVEDQRHICKGRGLLFLLGPRGRISPDCIIAAIISSGPEFLEDADAGQSLAFGLSGVGRQNLVEHAFPRPDLRLRLVHAFIGHLRHAGSDHLPHRTPRNPQLPADLLN